MATSKVPDPQTPVAQENIFLMAEDNSRDAELFSEMLIKASKGRFRIVCVDSFEKTMEALHNDQYKALILDFNLPGSEGFDNLRRLSSSHPELPIVVLTGLDDDDIAKESFQLGVQDFLSKQHINPEIFIRAIKSAVERKTIEQQLKQALEQSVFLNKQLDSMAREDPVTKIPNRWYFCEATERAIVSADRMNHKFAVLYLDLDEFKRVNDTFGHDIGDQVLKTVASRVKHVLRSEDTLARIGGDEFAVLLDKMKDVVFAYPIARNIYNSICKPMRIRNIDISLSVSIGVAVYPESNSVDNLLRHADIAMYEAKNNKDYFVHFYTKHHDKVCQRRLALENNLITNLNLDEFNVHYQTIVDAKTHQSIAVEALLRWHSRELGSCKPDEFIPIAEWSDCIHTLSDFVLSQSLELLRSLLSQGQTIQKVAVNIGGKQFADRQLAKRILNRIDEMEILPEYLCLEITERQIIDNIGQCQVQLEFLKARGVRIALDDYGTGFSSIAHLKQLPIDIIKIDRSLISHIDSNMQNQALTAGIIEMAHRLNIEVTGEGIERPQEADILSELDCDYLQGFLYSKPVDQQTLLKNWPNKNYLPAKSSQQ